MLVATTSFIQSLETWLNAVHRGDLGEARRLAEQTKVDSEMLTLRPEFRKCFAKHFPEIDPEQALEHLSHFLHCATECRALAIRGW